MFRGGGLLGLAYIGCTVGRIVDSGGRFDSVVGPRYGVEPSFDKSFDGVLASQQGTNVGQCQMERRGNACVVCRHTFWSLRSWPPSLFSNPCRIFFREMVSRSDVSRMSSMIAV